MSDFKAAILEQEALVHTAEKLVSALLRHMSLSRGIMVIQDAASICDRTIGVMLRYPGEWTLFGDGWQLVFVEYRNADDQWTTSYAQLTGDRAAFEIDAVLFILGAPEPDTEE